MAQAARLNLRMQRELKLLLSDPPPGATFPSLSPSSAAPSLSSIDAEIEGPDGTVYANGVFKLKIQIPERYPFQPPVVTFLTPIYHPNIDNGGRICLDILNLPPKGAWQPSLNISTVITSIGLLLSEPNPDDGLMHDASKEYKYNKQTFNQKARSMTEKFAMGQASEDAASVSHQEIQTRTNPHKDQLQVDDKGPDASNSNSIQCFLSQNRLWGVSRKLSLDSSGLKQPKVSTEGVEAGELLHYKDSTKELNETAANYLFGNHTEAGVSNQTRDTAKEVNETPVHYPSTNNIEARGLKHKRDVLSEVNALSANYLQVNQNEADCFHKEAVGLPSECKKLWGTKNMPISVVRNSDKKDDLMPVQGASHLGAQSSSIYPLTRDSRNAEIHANLSCMEFGRSSMDTSLKRKQSLQYHDLKQKSGKQLHTISHPSGHPHPQTTNHRHMDTVDRNLNKVTTTDHKKLGLSGRKMPLGQSSSSHSLQDNKENLVSSSSFANSKANMHSEPSASDAHVGKSSAKVVDNKLGGNLPRRPLQSVVHLQGSNDNHFQFDQKQPDQDNEQNLETNIKVKEIEPPTPDTVIVLDSEDSEDERNLPVRSKFSIARKCLPRKQKAKA